MLHSLMLKNYETHKKILMVMWETEKQIVGLVDPYGKDIQKYKAYLKTLVTCGQILYDNLSCEPDKEIIEEEQKIRRAFSHE